MCGIVAKYAADGSDVVKDVIEGLKKVSYRGYDAWGYGTSKGVFKKTNDVCLATDSGESDNICIGHTRWATHGENTIENAHPFASQSGKFLVVHNGIIENYQELKRIWQNALYFETSVDTEIIAKAIEWLLISNLQSVKTEIDSIGRQIQGHNAFVVLDKQEKRIYAYRKGNTPLYINKSWTLISSDPCVMGSIYALLPENEAVELTDKTQANELDLLWCMPPNIEKIEQEKNHQMLDEIYQQSTLLPNNLGWAKTFDIEFMQSDKFREVVLFGCGSSLNAAAMGKKFIEYGGYRCNYVHSLDVQDLDLSIYYGCLWIAISQSGETKDTLEAAKYLRMHNQDVRCITNNDYNSLAVVCGLNQNLGCGQENAVAATKTFFQTINTLRHMVGGYRINAWDYEIADMDEQVKLISPLFKDYKHMLILSDPFNYPIALEGALKLKEVSNIHAEALYSSEVKHGPISLIDDKVLSIFLLEDNKPEVLNNIEQVLSRNGQVLIIGSDKVSGMAHRIYTNDTNPDKFVSFLLALQFLSYYLAVAKGLNPDRPRNIAKAVTV